MTTNKRKLGKMVRRVVKLDRAWKANGMQEGRIENDLTWRMGQTIRAGVSAAKLDRARRVNG